MSNHLARARLLMQQNRFELAEEQLHLALMEGTETSTVHALLALCLLERDKFDEATLEAKQAIHDAPDEAFGFYALAAVQLKRNRLPEAKDAIQEAIRYEPWNSIHFSLLASIESEQYHWTESLAAAEQGLACDPDDIGCSNLRTIALINLGRKDEAGQSIEAALAKNPDDAVTHANQGWTLLHQRQPAQAMTHFREALRLEPNLEWARLGIIEAMKARFFLYRWLLTWFLWLGRFPPNVRLALIFGLVFGRSLLAGLIQAVPILEPLAGPLAFLYVLFVWMNWTAPALFNLVLRLDRFGRLVLNPSETLESTLVGICLLICLGVISTALFFDRRLAEVPWEIGTLYLGLMIPLTSTFRQPEVHRRLFAAYTAGVGLCVVFATYYALSYCFQANPLLGLQELPEVKRGELRALADSAIQWKSYSIWGIVVSTWIGAGMSLAPNRH